MKQKRLRKKIRSIEQKTSETILSPFGDNTRNLTAHKSQNVT